MKLARNLFIICAAAALILVSVHMCIADNFNMRVIEDGSNAKLVLTYKQKQYEVVLTPVAQQTSAVQQNTAPQTNTTTPANTQAVTLEQAKSIALKDAGLTQADFTKAKQDYDDGRQIYEIEFRSNGKEYDYDIEASTGRILKTDVDLYNNIFGSNQTQSNQQAATSAVTSAEAEDIALKDAGIAKANVTYIHTHNDNDDGRTVYDVEFRANGVKYEYSIGASDGKIYDKDIDRD